MKNVKSESRRTNRWKLSQYTYRLDRGDELILYNSLSGIVRKFVDPLRPIIATTLNRLPGEMETSATLMDDLVSAGFVVPEDIYERNRVRMLTERINDPSLLELTIMPTEQCNFRCIYCYESFARGTMGVDVREGIVNYVSRLGETLTDLRVHWFGGEPLLGWDALVGISEQLLALCSAHGIKYTAGMTTNGFLLTPERQSTLLGLGVSRYQISLDGLAENHDRHRIRVGGQNTFERIVTNIKSLLDRPERFHVTIRNNVDRPQLPMLGRYIEYITALAGHDDRVSLLLFPVGQWGGPHDDQLDVISDHRELWQAMECGLDAGIAVEPLNQLQPGGSVCYAARKNSLVIGSDGTIYKCTVALDDDQNQVGTIRRDGTLIVDQDKLALWLYSGTDDTTCAGCYFNAACQGAACPLHRMQENTTPCPDIKIDLAYALPLAAKL